MHVPFDISFCGDKALCGEGVWVCPPHKSHNQSVKSGQAKRSGEGRRNRRTSSFARQASGRQRSVSRKRICAPIYPFSIRAHEDSEEHEVNDVGYDWLLNAGVSLPGCDVDGTDTVDGAEKANILPFNDVRGCETRTAMCQGPVAQIAVQLTIQHGDRHEVFPSTTTPQKLRDMISERFSCAMGSFILRDAFTGSVVPISPLLCGGNFELEIVKPANWHASKAQANESRKGSDTSLEWIQQPPHGAAVWLHAKLTKQGKIADSCVQHVFEPPPCVKLKGVTDKDQAQRILSQLKVAVYDPTGSEIPGALHIGEVNLSQCHSTGEWSVSWPTMAITDITRAVSGLPVKAQRLSASELQAKRGATGWMELCVSCPGYTPDLWLRDGAGRKAKMVIKNERNAALSWRKHNIGPFADHSQCTGTHTNEDGTRRCQHCV